MATTDTAVSKLATRFRAKSEDPFNVALVDVTEVVDSQVRSLKQSISDNFTTPAQDLMSAGMAKIDSVKNSVTSNSTVRNAKSAYGMVKDISSLTKGDITNQIVDLLPSGLGSAKSKLASLATSCMDKGASWDGLGKRYDVDMTCNGGKKSKSSAGSCEASSFGDVLNSMTGGNYASTFNDLNKTLKAIVGLSKIGYDMNMCGVLGAVLSSGIAGAGNLSVLSRATAAIIAGVAGGGNVKATIDAVTATPDTVNPTLEIPALAAISTANYTTPEGLTATETAEHAEAYVGVLTILDGYYDDPDTLTNVTKLESNSALVSTLSTYAVSKSVVDTTNLNSVGATPETSLALLMMTKDPAFSMAV